MRRGAVNPLPPPRSNSKAAGADWLRRRSPSESGGASGIATPGAEGFDNMRLLVLLGEHGRHQLRGEMVLPFFFGDRSRFVMILEV